MKKSILLVLASCCSLFLMLTSCEYEKLMEPADPDLCDTLMVTYESEMKAVIDRSCAYTGCHDGMGGIGPFDYTTYEGLTNVFDDIEARVIELRDDPALGMPPDNSVYEQSRKDNLTQRELDLFRCWIDAGFPRN
ncbi:MAG: hypothetical protein R3350_02800 [Saprospiraceae bacterium]|nr:hypothetical protein [Saprospiraceae bacterium]